MADDYIRKADAIKQCGFGMTSLHIADNLRKMRPADVVQVRHGRWKKIGMWGRVYRCDQCGNFLDFDGVNAGRGDANFCPNCGARMDSERKE